MVYATEKVYFLYLQIFLALSCGATLLIVPEKIKKSPTQLAAVLLHRQHVTVMQVTPALIYRLPEAEIKGRLLGEESCVRTLAFGGETCPSLHLLAKWKDPKVSQPLLHGSPIVIIVLLSGSEFDRSVQYLWNY